MGVVRTVLGTARITADGIVPATDATIVVKIAGMIVAAIDEWIMNMIIIANDVSITMIDETIATAGMGEIADVRPLGEA